MASCAALALSGFAVAGAPGEPPIFEASFSGPGEGTGGPSDLVLAGGTGRIRTVSPGAVRVETDSPFGAGNYLLASVHKGETEGSKPAPQYVELLPSSPEHSPASWGTIQDGRWAVSGALDFLFAPDFDIKRLGQFLPFRTGKNPGGLSLTIRNLPEGPVRGAFCVILEGPAHAFGPGKAKLIIAPDSQPFALRGGSTHHLALTLQSGKSGEVVMRLYGREDVGEIRTLPDSPDLLAEATFVIDPNVVKSLHLFSPGAFDFGNLDGRGINEQVSAEKSQMFDTLRIYRGVPAVFPAPSR